MDAATAYFLKKYYPHVIKWWLVTYNPEVVRVWPTRAEKKEALKKERLQLEAEKKLALETQADSPGTNDSIDDAAYNAATGSYSGLYGKGPVDDQTKEALDAILSLSSNQNTVDSLLLGDSIMDEEDAPEKKNPPTDVVLSPEHDDIIKEANAIYERLLQEAAEDEAKKQAEIEAVRQQVEQTEQAQNAG